MDDSYNLALLIARVWLAIMILAHGYNHLKRTINNQGVAEWFESLGVRPGKFHAWTVSLTEVGVPALLIPGLLTPIAYGGLAALMVVAWVTAHRQNGFFIFKPGQGWEYVATVAILAIALGAFGGGEWSLDDAFGIDFSPGRGLALSAIVGLGGAAAFLGLFWRPPRPTETS